MKNIFTVILFACMAVGVAAQPMIPPSNVSPITGPAVVGRGAGNGRATTITLGPNLTITNNVIDSIGGGGGSGNVTAAASLDAGNIVIGQGASAVATSSTFSISGSNATVTGNLIVTGNQTVGNMTTTNLTITGSITGVMAAVNGGTGFSSTTAGNIIVGNNTTTYGQLGIGANGTVLTANTSAPLKVSWEPAATGTGNVTGGSLTDNHIVLGNGTNSVGVVAGLGSTGQPLVSAGVGAPPAFAVLGVAGGGTSLATLTANSIFIGNGTNTPIQLAPGTSGNIATSDGTQWLSTAPSFFKNIVVSGCTTVSSNTTGNITLVAGGNITLTTDNTTKNVTITANATGSGGSLTKVQWTALDNQPPATSYATLSTLNSVALLTFVNGSDTDAIFVANLPEGTSLTTGLSVIIKWTAGTATTGDCVWVGSWMRCTTDIDTDSFATGISATTTTSGTAGIPNTTTIDFNGTTEIDGLTVGDMFRLKITRDGDAGGDTMSGDAQVLTVETRQR